MFYAVLVLIAALLTSCYINYLFLNDIVSQDAPIDVAHPDSQSYLYEEMKEHDAAFRQVEEELERTEMKIAIYNQNAYWITDSGLVTAPVDEEGEVLRSLERAVDVHSLSTKEARMLMDILDALKEANDDSGDSGQ